MRNIRILEIASEYGAGTRGSSMGSRAIRWAALNRGFKAFGNLPWERIDPDPGALFENVQFPTAKNIDRILDVYAQSAALVQKTVAGGEFPLVISGDHSNAIGTIAGLKACDPDKRIGLVWIDAHADLHTPFSTPSGNVHGMPVAASLNFDNRKIGENEPAHETQMLWRKICEIGDIAPKIRPQDIVFIGVRDAEEEEEKLIMRHNIRSYSMDQVDGIGIGWISDETLSYLDHCDVIYVSFDIDSLDARLVPGTGTPVKNGLSVSQAQTLLRNLWNSPKLGLLEFTEINPLLDIKNQTAGIAAELLENVLGI